MSNQATGDVLQLSLNTEFKVSCTELPWTGLDFTSQNPLNGNVTIGGQTMSFQGGSDNNNTLSFQFIYGDTTYLATGILRQPGLIDSGTLTKPAGRGAVDAGTWSATAPTQG